MYASDFLVLLVWVLAPPLLIGLVVLKLLPASQGAGSKKRFGSAALLLAMLAGVMSFLLVVLAPAWLGRFIGMRQIQIFGIGTFWAPFAFIAVGLAFPVAAWWAGREMKQ